MLRIFGMLRFASLLAIAGSAPGLLAQAVPNEFEVRASLSVGPAPFSVAVGDFNYDGKLDTAVVSPYFGYVQVLLGNGDGTFQAAVNYSVATSNFVVAADLNHDGNLDLVVGTGTNNVSVLAGNGDGTFQTAVPYNTPCAPVLVGVADFNGDHKLDVIVSYSDSACRFVSVLLGNGDGTLQEPPINTTPSYYPTAFGVGDFDRDGRQDVAVAEQFGTVSQVEILIGNGDGTFSLGKSYAVGSEPSAVAVGDFRNAGKLDLVVPADLGETSVLLGNADGTFQPAKEYVTYGGVWAAPADFNGDGKLDFAIAELAFPSGVTVFLGNGDGTFQQPKYYPFGGEVRSLGVGDFNRDHKVDLIIPDELNSVVITALNTGVVDFSPPTPPNFPFQLLGTTGAAQTVALLNTGTTVLSISSIKVSGPFGIQQTCGKKVAPLMSCKISASFTPTVEGATTGTITIIDSASSKPQVIELTGAGTVLGLSPLSLSFQPQKVGTTSLPQQVQVTNIGSTAVSLTRIYIAAPGGQNSEDFSQTNNCGSQIAAHAGCTVNVTFSPTKTGTRTGTLGFLDNGGGSPQTVPLTGTGD